MADYAVTDLYRKSRQLFPQRGDPDGNVFSYGRLDPGHLLKVGREVFAFERFQVFVGPGDHMSYRPDGLLKVR